MSYTTITGSLSIERIRLEARRFLCEQRIDINELGPIKLRMIEEEIGRRFVVQLQQAVASRKYDVKTVRFPADWRQAFKERWFPKWALKRWPVKYQEVTMEANAYYPDIQIPEHQTFVEVMLSARMKELTKQYQ